MRAYKRRYTAAIFLIVSMFRFKGLNYYEGSKAENVRTMVPIGKYEEPVAYRVEQNKKYQWQKRRQMQTGDNPLSQAQCRPHSSHRKNP